MEAEVNGRQPIGRPIVICSTGFVYLTLVLVFLFASGCLGLESHKRQPDSDDQDCAGVSCWEPPRNSCAGDDTLQIYSPRGSCSGGECSYPTWQDQCHSGICDEGVCVSTPCQGITCIDPPDAFCTDENRTIFAPSGYCSGGICEYASKTSSCDYSCESGSCIDSPCTEVFCRKQPAPYCLDDSNLAMFEPEGRCVVVGEKVECRYEVQKIPCPNGCKAGRCLDNPCMGVVCDRPPARYCDGAVLVLFEPFGICNDGGFCSYTEQRHPCVDPCADAHCGEDDACTWVTCNEPSAVHCADTNTLRIFAREGWCEDGFCFYVSSDLPCVDGCEEGRCKNDPCLGLICDRAPAAYCDGKVLVDFEQKGACNEGTCSYQKKEKSCQDGCENAKCLTGGDTDTDTNTDIDTDTDDTESSTDSSSWSDSAAIRLDTSIGGANVATDQLNFPVLIRLNNTNFDFAQAEDDGKDVRFRDSAEDPLFYEIERWDRGSELAVIWVKVPTVLGNNSSQYIYMYWGNSDATDQSDGAKVFDTANDFAAVWHLNEDPTGDPGCVKDRTSNENHGEPRDMEAGDLVDGDIGKGMSFDGIDDRITFDSTPSLNSTAQISVSCWIKTAIDASVVTSIVRHVGHFSAIHPREGSGATVLWHPVQNSYRWTWLGQFDDDQWHHYAAVYDQIAGLVVYRDGTELFASAEHTGALATTTSFFSLGAAPAGEAPFAGLLDEVRVSNTVRSADWMKLCYENQKLNDSLVKFE